MCNTAFSQETEKAMKGVGGLGIVVAMVFLALIGPMVLPVSVLAGGNGDNNGGGFQLQDFKGRYVSAENAYDLSSVHAFAAPNGSLVGPPIFFATAEVIVADGKGNVCGEADGFYSGISAPGVNLGPALYHGTYTIDPNGRITILTCSDGAPSAKNTFCGTSTPCAPVTKAQVGYLQAQGRAKKVVTVEQSGFGTDIDSTGFLAHKREWTSANAGEGEGD